MVFKKKVVVLVSNIKNILLVFILGNPFMALAQSPAWLSSTVNTLYNNVYDEMPYVSDSYEYKWQLPLLRGAVKKIEIEDIFETLKPVIGSFGNGFRFYFDLKKTLFDSISFYRINVSYSDTGNTYEYIPLGTERWSRKENGSVYSKTYIDEKRDADAAVTYDYPSFYLSNQIPTNESWIFFYKGIVNYGYPFCINYSPNSEGGYCIKGEWEAPVDTIKTEKRLKYCLTYNKKNQLLERIIYNRDFRTIAENKIEDRRIYQYSYDSLGVLLNLKHKKGNEKEVVYIFKYVDIDEQGNWQIQEVWVEGKLERKISRKFTYYKKEEQGERKNELKKALEE